MKLKTIYYSVVLAVSFLAVGGLVGLKLQPQSGAKNVTVVYKNGSDTILSLFPQWGKGDAQIEPAAQEGDKSDVSFTDPSADVECRPA